MRSLHVDVNLVDLLLVTDKPVAYVTFVDEGVSGIRECDDDDVWCKARPGKPVRSCGIPLLALLVR